MIEHIHGTLVSKGASRAVVEAGGVGYLMEIPLSTFEKLPDIGSEATLVTHFHVREDAQKLYGFLTEGEREIFRELIGVSQIGPKVALSVLSRLSVADLVDAVTRGDTARFKGVPGVGKKTADRLIMELRSKLKGLSGAGADAGTPAAGGTGGHGVREDTMEALLALGYNEAQVSRALQRVAEVVEAGAPVEEWIRKALQVM